MKMTFRWYGSQMDPIPLRYIKQIPNMSGVVSSLMDMPAGALWPTERIRALKQEVNDAGLELEVIEGNQRAIGLYHKMGFVCTGEKPNAIRLEDGSSLKELMMVKVL